MNRAKLTLAIVFAMLLASCGGNNSKREILAMMDSHIDATITSCTSGGWSRTGYQKERFFYADISGETILEVTGPEMETFSNGLLYVHHRYGEEEGNRFVNTKGEIVINLDDYGGSGSGSLGEAHSIFDRFSDGTAFIQANKYEGDYMIKRCIAIDTHGKVLFEIDGKPLTPMISGYFMMRNDQGTYIVDKKGNIVISATKDSNLSLGDICGARRDMVVAYVNHEYAGLLEFATGKYLLPNIPYESLQYSAIIGIDWNDRAVFEKDNRYGLVDRDGNIVVEPIYNRLVPDGDWYLASKDGYLMWINKDGETMVRTPGQLELEANSFNEIVGFGTGNLCYIGNGFFINRKGEVDLITQFQAMTPFINGKAIVKVHEGDRYSFAWIDEEGKICSKYIPINDWACRLLRTSALGHYWGPNKL